MKTIIILTALIISTSAFASKGYQVTGPVMDVSATSITVQKGKETWEIAKDATTKGAAEVKKGDKVTVYYTMAAQEVEVKADKKSG